jgi:hypothetical protein
MLRHFPAAAEEGAGVVREELDRLVEVLDGAVVLVLTIIGITAADEARSPYVVTAIRRLQTLRHLHACPGCFRLERSPGGACTRWKSAAFSRRMWIADIPARFLRS